MSQQWQPISSAPYNIKVLVWIPWLDECLIGVKSNGYSSKYYKSGWKIWHGTYACYPSGTPSAWMPLPPAPQFKVTDYYCGA